MRLARYPPRTRSPNKGSLLGTNRARRLVSSPPIRFRVWSSRQALPAPDWSTFSWCERLWPINVRQSTPRVLAWRRELHGRLRRAGGGRDVRRWPRLLALPTPRRLNTGGSGRSRQVSPASRSRKDGVRQVSRPPGGVLQPAAIPHGRPAEFHTQDGPGKPSILAPSQACGRC